MRFCLLLVLLRPGILSLDCPSRLFYMMDDIVVSGNAGVAGSDLTACNRFSFDVLEISSK